MAETIQDGIIDLSPTAPDTIPASPDSQVVDVLTEMFTEDKNMLPSALERAGLPVDTPPAEPTPSVQPQTYTDSNAVAANAQPITQPTTEPVVQPPAQPVQPQTPAVPVQPVEKTYTQADIDAMRTQIETESLSKYQNLATAIEELNKNPYATLAKTAPHLFKEFDANGYIQSKLVAEFGEFKPKPEDYYTIGTDSYNYIQRLNALNEEVKSYQNTAQGTISNNQVQAQENLKTFKTNMMKELGMDETTFNPIWSKVESMNDEDFLKVVVQGVIATQKLTDRGGQVTQTAQVNQIPPSPALVPGTGAPQQTTKVDPLVGLFGTNNQY